MSTIYNKEDFATLEPARVVDLNPSFLQYNKELGLLICSECSLAILNSNGIKKHLNEKHSSTRVSKEALEALKSNSIISYLDKEARIPDKTYYFPDLPLILKGFTCSKCSFIALSYKKLREHLIKVEGIKGESTRKRDDISTIPVQVLYPTLNKGLFIPKLPRIGIKSPNEPDLIELDPFSTISRDDQSSSSTASYTSSASDIDNNDNYIGPSLSYNLYSDYKAKKEDIINKSSEIGEVDFRAKSLSSFLKNSRFNKFLEGKNIKDLLDLITPPLKEEPLLELLNTISFELSYKLSTIIPNILRFIRIDIRKDNTIDAFLRSKDFIELESTSKRYYFKVFSNLLVFITRLYLIKYKEKPSNNKDFIKNDIDFSTDLTTALNNLLLYLKVYSNNKSDKEALNELETIIILIIKELLVLPIKLTTLKTFTLFRNPTIIFFILNTLDNRKRVFKEIGEISKLASIFIYNTRLYILGYLSKIEERKEEGTYNLEEEYYYYSNNYLRSNSKNYFGEIINIRNYTIKIAKEVVSKNRPILVLDPNRIIVYNNEYSITGLSTLFKDLIIRLKTTLFRDLIDLDINTLPSINLSTIQDNPLLRNIDNYLLDNPNLESYKDYLVKLLLEPGSRLNKRYIKSVLNNKPVFTITNITKFYKKRKEFIELLSLALYLTTSSPLRGEELVSITFRNTRDNIRNIIFNKEEELIVITTSYYKSYNITRKNKENIRFLNKDLSIILIYYLVYIIPLYDYFNIEYFKITTLSSLLLENKGESISATSLSTSLYRFSSSYFRNGLTLNPYRHLINYIIKEYLGYNIDPEDDEEEEEDTIIDILANRSSKVGNLSYSREINLFSTTRNLFIRSLKLCRAYFKFFKIDEDTLRDLDSSLISNINAIALLERSSKSNSSILDFIENLKNPKVKLLEEYLRDFYKDKTTTFRDIYLPKALEIVLNNKFTYLTYINKTGSGKSLLFLLPSFINRRTITLALTPRISLKEDLYNKAKDKNIPTFILEDLDFEDTSYIPLGLILGSIDNILGDTFGTLLRLSIREKIPITIFLDEVHALLLESNYRPILKYLDSLLRYKVPLVFISATLPEPLLRLLNKEFRLNTNDNTVIKGPLNREDISYNIVNPDPKKTEIENILNILSIIRAKGLGPKKKALLFINNTAKGKSLSKELDIGFYYSNNPDKDALLEEFLRPTSDRLFLLTTSSLSIGIDFTIISYTVHLLPLYSLIDFIQESSRIRNKGESYILSNLRPTLSSTSSSSTILIGSNITTVEEFRAYDKAFINYFLRETKCLRGVINRFLDPSTSYLECNLSKDLPCSLCLKGQVRLDSKAFLEEEDLKAINLGLISLEKRLLGLEIELCLICLIEFDIRNSIKHSTTACPFITRDIDFNPPNYLSLSTRIRDRIQKSGLIQPNSGCYTCLFPNRICSRLRDINSTSECLYPNLLYITLGIFLRAIIKDIETRDNRVLLYFNLDIRDLGFTSSITTGNIDRMLRYLLEPLKIYTTDSIRLISIIDKFDTNSILEIREKEEEREKEERRLERYLERERAILGTKGSISSSRSSSTKRPRTPPRIIENLVLSPNTRDKKVSRKGKEKEER